MKRIMLLLVGAIISASVVRAQEIPDRKTEESKPVVKEKIVDKKERANLNLTEDQKAKLKTMNQDMRKQMEDLRKQDNISVKEYRDRMETLRKDRQTQFQSILTEDQKTQLQKNREARTARTKEFGRKRQERMKTELNLSDEQVSKLKENGKSMAEKTKAIREDGSLTEEQKKEKMKDVMKERKQYMKSILTDDQLQKMKEYHKQHPSEHRKVV